MGRRGCEFRPVLRTCGQGRTLPLRFPGFHGRIGTDRTPRLHPDVPESLRGSYAGLASEPVIRHLKTLNVTAIELLPVHHHLNDRHLIERGLSNYWGYNTLGFFAPHFGYQASNPALNPVA